MERLIKPQTKLDTEKIKRDFPVLDRKVNGKRLVYLDNAATTQKPRSVIECIKNYYESHNANIHRGVHTLSYESTVMYEEGHKKVAELIGAGDWREIIFTRNATESINLVAHGWGLHNLEKGDEVVITIMEHHSNIVPWQMLRDQKGITLKFVDVYDNGTLRLDQLKEHITERTKLVSVIHASNVTGAVNPISEISEEAKKVGALVLVDAAQTVPHMEVDVDVLGCDFLVASGHKMLGPTGIGFLYGRERLLESMSPFMYGGDMIEKVTMECSTWNELPWKFEAGTPNIAGGIALGAAVDYMNSVGLENIYAHETGLMDYAVAKIEEIPWINTYVPQVGEHVGVISFNVEGVHPHDVAGTLDEEGVAVRSGHHCAQPLMERLGMDYAARISFYIYNTKEDIDITLKALEKAKNLFG